MTQATIIEAYKVLLTKLSRQELPIREAWNVAKLMDTLKPFWAFQMDEERKFLETRKWRTTPDGVEFENAEDAKAFTKKLDDIMALEQEVDIKPFTLNLNNSVKLTAKDIAALDGFVEFVED